MVQGAASCTEVKDETSFAPTLLRETPPYHACYPPCMRLHKGGASYLAIIVCTLPLSSFYTILVAVILPKFIVLGRSRSLTRLLTLSSICKDERIVVDKSSSVGKSRQVHIAFHKGIQNYKYISLAR